MSHEGNGNGSVLSVPPDFIPFYGRLWPLCTTDKDVPSLPTMLVLMVLLRWHHPLMRKLWSDPARFRISERDTRHLCDIPFTRQQIRDAFRILIAHNVIKTENRRIHRDGHWTKPIKHVVWLNTQLITEFLGSPEPLTSVARGSPEPLTGGALCGSPEPHLVVLQTPGTESTKTESTKNLGGGVVSSASQSNQTTDNVRTGISDPAEFALSSDPEPCQKASRRASKAPQSGDESAEVLYSAPQLSAIYEAYPRHICKYEAFLAIRRALRRVPFDQLLAATKAYAVERRGEDREKTPYPATWFNGRRWEACACPEEAPVYTPSPSEVYWKQKLGIQS